MARKMIKCSQCNEEFENGYGYREHWEQKHFYPYLKSNSFNYKQALLDKKNV